MDNPQVIFARFEVQDATGPVDAVNIVTDAVEDAPASVYIGHDLFTEADIERAAKAFFEHTDAHHGVLCDFEDLDATERAFYLDAQRAALAAATNATASHGV